jgi:arylsulfatase
MLRCVFAVALLFCSTLAASERPNMAICLNVTGIPYPSQFNGRQPPSLEEKSLAPVLRGQQRSGHDALAWNCARGRAIRRGPWKMVRPRDDRDWELYNLEHAPGETIDLARQFLARVQDLAKTYETGRKRVGAH